MDGIDMWEVLHRRRVKAAVAAWEAHPDYPATIAEAATKGYTPATVDQRLNLGNDQLFIWRGHLWVRAAAAGEGRADG